MIRITSTLKWAAAGAICASVLLLPMYILGSLICLLDAVAHHFTWEHAGELIGSTGVWIAALILLAASAGFVYGCYEAFWKKPGAAK